MSYNQAVLKSAKNYQGQTLWEAIYLDGEKVLENFFLDENALIQAFGLENVKIIKLPFHEKEVENFAKLFPDNENFSYLYETLPVKVGQKVYIDEYQDDDFIIEGGWVTVKDVYSLPNTNLIWESGTVFDDEQVWFSCTQLPGVFYWNRLAKIQNELENRLNDRTASLKDRKDRKID